MQNCEVKLMLMAFFFSSKIREQQGRILLSSANEAIQSLIPAERRVEAESPIMNLRIIKNDKETDGMREAHKRDGAAMIKYLYFLETEVNDQNVTEAKGADKLKSFKKYGTSVIYICKKNM